MKETILLNDLVIKEEKNRFSTLYYNALYSKDNFNAQLIVFPDEKLQKINEFLLSLINKLFVFSKSYKEKITLKTYFVYADEKYLSLLIKGTIKSLSLNFDLNNSYVLYPEFVVKLRGLTFKDIKRHIRKINKNLEADFDTVHLSDGALKILVRDKKINEEIYVKILQKNLIYSEFMI